MKFMLEKPKNKFTMKKHEKFECWILDFNSHQHNFTMSTVKIQNSMQFALELNEP